MQRLLSSCAMGPLLSYFASGLVFHLLLWLLAVLRCCISPASWPDKVEKRRKSEGGPQAVRGEGHECYEYDTPGWPPYAVFKLAPWASKATGRGGKH